MNVGLLLGTPCWRGFLYFASPSGQHFLCLRWQTSWIDITACYNLQNKITNILTWWFEKSDELSFIFIAICIINYLCVSKNIRTEKKYPYGSVLWIKLYPCAKLQLVLSVHQDVVDALITEYLTLRCPSMTSGSWRVREDLYINTTDIQWLNFGLISTHGDRDLKKLIKTQITRVLQLIVHHVNVQMLSFGERLCLQAENELVWWNFLPWPLVSE